MNPTSDFAPLRTNDKKRNTGTPARTLAAYAVDAALDKKARDITVLDMRDVSGIADYFIICTGEADLQVKAIVDAVQLRIKEEADERPWKNEGEEHRTWVILDYVDLVVHVFGQERRAFYDLERLWGDAPVEHVPDDASSSAVVALLQD